MTCIIVATRLTSNLCTNSSHYLPISNAFLAQKQCHNTANYLTTGYSSGQSRPLSTPYWFLSCVCTKLLSCFSVRNINLCYTIPIVIYEILFCHKKIIDLMLYYIYSNWIFFLRCNLFLYTVINTCISTYILIKLYNLFWIMYPEWPIKINNSLVFLIFK